MTVEQKPEDLQITDSIHRKLAVSLFNSTWDLIDKHDRTTADDDAMISGAHASLYHWSKIGGPEQLTVGRWQIAHVYTILKLGQTALYHAMRCLDICVAHGIGDWRLAFAYEAVARAYAALDDPDNCRRHRAKAAEVGAEIAAPGERDHFQSELAKGPWFDIN